MSRIVLIMIAAVVLMISIFIHCATSTEMFVTLHDDWKKVPDSSFFNVTGTPCNTEYVHGDSRLVTSELSDEEFMKLFKKTFQTTPSKVSIAKLEEVPLPLPNPVPIIDWMRVQIKNVHENIQIVSWRQNKVYVYKNSYLHDIDFIFYRIPAYHGKHIRMLIHEETGQPWVVSAKLIGQTAADKILFHPLEQYDPILMSKNQATTESEFTLPSLSEKEVAEMVRRQQDKIHLR